MNRPMIATCALALAVFASRDARTASATPADAHVHQPLTAGKTLQLANVNGDVEVTLSDDASVDVRAVVRKSAGPMRVVTRDEDGSVAVCVMYPDDRDEDCRLGRVKHRDHHGHDGDVRIDLVARLPRGAKLVAQDVNGAIHARGLQGDVDAETINGEVAVETTGVASAKTVNGSIDASLGTAPSGPVSFLTTNGEVSVRLPAKLDADVEAATTHGSISATFPITIDEKAFGIGATAHGRIGKGGVRIEARTVNGSIALRGGA